MSCKIAFYTLGCRSNQYETDKMASDAQKAGFEIVPFPSSADVYVINTCTVTSNADRKARSYIRQTKKLNPRSKLIVTGCYVSTDRLKLPEIDQILSNKEKPNIIRHLNLLTSQHLPLSTSHSSCPSSSYSSSNRIRMNLMIEDGCENFCSYCIVPFVRGPVRSRPIEEIISEAKEMVNNGVKEIVLTGINLGEFSREPRIHSRVPIIMLIDKLSDIKGLLRIRLSSIEPQYVTEELIDLIKTNPKVCHHLHIPLQSGDDGILKAMKRKYSVKSYELLVNNIRKRIPDIAITTDIIVGFPGEDEKAFNNTLKMAKACGFSRIHVFSYSDRPGTAASLMKNKVSPQAIKNRYGKLTLLRDKSMKEFEKNFIGKTLEFLCESKNRNGKFECMSGNYIRMGVSKPLPVGELVKVKLKASDIIRT